MKVLAAMSGGVDSAVAAARAVEAGHDVTGVHLALSKNPQSFRSGARGCCSKEDAHDARRAADGSASRSTSGTCPTGSPPTWSTTSWPSTPPAGRPTRACAATRRSSSPRCWTGRSRSASTRSAPGTTPGWSATTTGCQLHRAGRRRQGPVLRARRARQDQLRRSYFPLGGSLKSEVRAEAERRGLAVADKPDSHDICFIADGDTAGFLTARLGEPPGRHRRRVRGQGRRARGQPPVHHRPAPGSAARRRRRPTASRASCSTSPR